ncbi:MAG: hypothetical protein KKF16_08985 [Euryarchaeota archaeon]|nr:hypothetical protein [Euryarchaeota archaeon]MBU4607583.1 hypothetical protein [Euryarchaeota archaeon]MBV1728860.1 hypothetical protein [Methanobacterium sp.]MBV1754871.1 hypothetical protein [Methanobacterium sp.]
MKIREISAIILVCISIGLIFGCVGSDSESTNTTGPISTEDLNNPEDVQNVLDLYDANNDGKLEVSGSEEYILWAYESGFRADDAETINGIFKTHDKDGDGYWDKYEIDAFIDSPSSKGWF